jgi:hypothetical protein
LLPLQTASRELGVDGSHSLAEDYYRAVTLRSNAPRILSSLCANTVTRGAMCVQRFDEQSRNETTLFFSMNSHPPNSAAQARLVPKHPILGKTFAHSTRTPVHEQTTIFRNTDSQVTGLCPMSVIFSATNHCLARPFRLSRNFPVIRCNEGRSCTTPQCDTVVTILQGLSGSVGYSFGVWDPPHLA